LLDEFCSDGIDERTAVLDENELVVDDVGETLAGEVSGAQAGWWTEKIEGDAFASAEARAMRSSR